MNILKSYASSLMILFGIIIGGIVGHLMGDSALIFKPFGQLFLNFMFVTIVPLVFFSISSSIASTNQTSRLRRILLSSVIVFVFTGFLAAILAYFGFLWYQPLQSVNTQDLLVNLTQVSEITTVSFGEMLINTFTANDFLLLFKRDNLLALIIFSILVGISTILAGEKGKPIASLLQSGSEVILRLIKIIMYAAPIGLGCYFAAIIGELGSQIVGAYFHTFILYLILSIIVYFVFNTLYAYTAAGGLGVKVFWQNVLTPSLTAIATASSAACIPVNLIAAKNMFVPDDIAETVVPLGANTHKDGSVIGGIFKIMFLFALFEVDPTGISMFAAIIGVSLLVGIVIGAIPSGGMTAEVMICTLFGFPVEYVGVILVVSIIIDVPATLLNSIGNTSCAMLITRLTEGKDWLKKQKTTGQLKE